MSQTQTVEPPARLPATLHVPEQPTLGEVVSNYISRVRGGDMGSLPAVLGLIVLFAIFAALRPNTFTTAFNIANLFQQGAVVATIAMGLVFVLLLGEIDLSAGFTSGVAGALLAVTLTLHGWPWYLSVLLAIAAGAVIGLVLGTLVAKIGIPSFIVTLGGFLAFQGVVLGVVGTGGNIPINDQVIKSIQNNNLSPVVGWALGLVVVVGFAVASLVRRSRRVRSNLLVTPLPLVLIQVVALAVVVLGMVWVFNNERSRRPDVSSIVGVPIVIPLIAVLAIGLTFLLARTAFGRHVYAVGGNAEATRRAGISVARIRITCFMICSSLAAVAGIFAASRATSVAADAGGGNTLLYAVGAAVIGGTSLFGGRGKVVGALIGGAVIAVIDNGMGLLGYPQSVKFVVTGAVLVIAAGVDALSRRRSQATGRG